MVASKVHVESSTEVVATESFTGQVAVAIRFNHNAEATSAAILGLTVYNALTLAQQLIEAVQEVQA